MKTRLVIAALAASISVGYSAQASPKASKLVEKANLAYYYAGKDTRATVRMIIVDGRGRKMRRQFVLLRRDVAEQKEQQFLLRFEQPADVRNTVFLVMKNPAADDDRWMYLPALDLVRRIAASDERTSFVGSHVFYEDISGRNPNDDKHSLLKSTKQHWILESRPKRPGQVEFAKYQLHIRKKDYLPEKIEYFDAKGRLIRRLQAARIEVIDGQPTITRLKVEDLASGGHTLVAYGRIEYDIDVPKDVFSERSLRNPPARWLNGR